MILNSPYISGSLTVTGNITAQGGIAISGSIASSSFATTASNALALQGLGSASFAPAETFNTVSQSFATTSGSLSTRVTANENNITTLTAASASFAVASGSMSSRVTLIEGQYATTGSNNFTKPQQISDVSNAISFTSTASLYTAGGLRVSKDSFVSGTAYFNNIVVYGTSSIQYITSSQLDISDNIISVNTFTPAVRFGGLAVYDSGSTSLTGSMLWDSEYNRWVYSNPSGSTYDGGMLISGPRNTTGLGNEVGTTSCALMMGQGGDHITSSAIFSYGNATCFYGNAKIDSTGSACFASCVSTGGSFYSYIAGQTALRTYTKAANVEISSYQSDVGSPYTKTTDIVANADTGVASQMRILTAAAGGNPTTALFINCNGLACFASQVCASTVVASTCLAVRAGSATVAVNNIAGAASNNHVALQRNDVQYGSIGLNGSDYFTIFGINTSCPRLTIDSSGNVGIGTTAPTTALEVCSADLNNIFVTNPTTTGTTTGSGIGFKAYNGTSVAQAAGIILTSNTWSYGTYSANQLSVGSDGTGGLALRTANAAPISLFTGGATAGLSTEKLRITCDGYVAVIGNQALKCVPYLQGMSFGWNRTNGQGESMINWTNAGGGNACDLVFNFRDSSTLYERLRITSTGISCFSGRICAPSVSIIGDSLFCSAGSTTITLEGTTPIINLTRNNNASSPAAQLNFKTSQGTVRWQIATNSSTGTGLEINQGDGVNRVFYIDTSGRLSLSCYLFVNGGGIGMDLNASTTTISNYGYGGAIQLLRSDATSTRWSRIGIVDSSLNWVGGLQINSNLVSVFDSTVCAPTFRGNFQSATCTFAATVAGTNYDLAYPGSGRWLASVNTNSTYHWNGILALNFFDSADYSVNILTCGSYATLASFSIVGSGAVLRMCFNQNVGNVTVNYLNF